MPRILMACSVLFGQRAGAFRGDRRPPDGLAACRTPGEPGKWWQDDEVMDRQEHPADDTSEPDGQPQVRLPQAAEARPPQSRPVMARLDASELHEGVVHVKRLVVEDLVEHRACRAVVF